MAVFYRTHRPQTFGEVVGQKPIITTLINSVSHNMVAHAYLFTGSRGVGKTTVARLLAKAVNCTKVKKGEPCGKCEVCMAIQKNMFIDLVEIDAASNTGVDNVRELIEHIKFKPTSGKYKVFIIDEVHMLSKAAFNALLKTLEEPPEHAIFVLATTDIHKVPATIISRTQRFDFGRITMADIVEQLEKVAKLEKLQLGQDVLALVARQSQGSLRDALSLLNKIASTEGKISIEQAESMLGITSMTHCHDLVRLLAEGDASKIPSYFDELEQQGTDFAIFNRNFLDYLRALLVLKVTGDVHGMYLPEEQKDMQQQIQSLSASQIMLWLRLFLRAFKDLSVAPEPSLALLLAAMEAVVKPEPSLVNSKPNHASTSAPTTQPKVASLNTEPANPEQSSPVVTKQSMPEIEEQDSTDEIDGDPYTLEEVIGFWPQLLDRLRLINSPLATLIKNSPVTKVAGLEIFLSVKYLFHKEHLESKKVLSLLQSTINELGGRPARIRIEISNTKAEDEPSGVDAIGEALRVFGGELVE